MKTKILSCVAAAFIVYACGAESPKTEKAKVKGNTITMPKGYTTLVFQDEFEGEGLPNAEKWSFEEGYLRNGELQYYTKERLENCCTKEGYLYITARNDSCMIGGKVRSITSSSIITKGKHDWTYCRVEVRAKLPICLGTWPAIWMMPSDNSYGWWPKSGEIDIMEHVGYEPEKTHYAIHTEAFNHSKNNGIGSNIFNPNPDEFHVYAFEWHADRLEWFFDGRKRFESKRPQNSTWENWPFDRPFYLILNFAFGGGWGGKKGIDISSMPLEYVIDYVRIYQ